MALDWDFIKVASDKNFDFSDNYRYEIKWDGIRCMIETGEGKIFLHSKNKVNISNRFPEIREALMKLKDHQLLIDGELVVLNSNGRPEFLDVMKRFGLSNPMRIEQARKTLRAKFFAFDLIYDDGDIQSESLEERHLLLTNLLEEVDKNRVEVNARFDDGHALFDQLKEWEMEGLVAKRKGSSYTTGTSRNWIKVKNRIVTECIISEVMSTGEKTLIRVASDDQDRGVVELGITRDNYELLAKDQSVLVEHGMLSNNGHFREPYLKRIMGS